MGGIGTSVHESFARPWAEAFGGRAERSECSAGVPPAVVWASCPHTVRRWRQWLRLIPGRGRDAPETAGGTPALRPIGCPLLPVVVLLLACLCLHDAAASGDTGTYKILDYTVKLTPKSDGAVEISYYQRWLVTGGHIPWITVGTPNSDFQIVSGKFSGAVSRIRADSSGDWSGVHIDLDDYYRPNETFEVGFTIVQNRLFHADKDSYRLDFTPGWYDRAETVRLSLEVFFFAKLDTVTAKPRPTRIAGQSMVWEKSGLRPGERFQISVSFPKALFPKEIGKGQLRSGPPVGAAIVIVVLLLGGFTVLAIIIVRAAVLARSTYGSGGGIFYGGREGALGPGSRLGRGSGLGPGHISTGGGGGFGGAASSCVCACACAGCACACACAGGGGAGCDRKLTHTCPLCRECERRSDCPLWSGALAT
jgi:hypothetical protein